MHIETYEEAIARGVKITQCPAVGSGELGRQVGVVLGIHRQERRWSTIIAFGDGRIWQYSEDHPWQRPPPKRARVSFVVAFREGGRRAVMVKVEESAADRPAA